MASPYQAVPTSPSAMTPEGYASVPGVAPPVVPFDQASHVVFEEGPSWTNLEPKAEAQVLETKPLPANGYLRNIWVEVTTTTPGSGTGTVMENYPWNILQRLELLDQGGHTISSLTGYNWQLADKYGGYLAVPDLTQLSMFSNTATAPAFTLIIPLELAPTGFGALTNMTEATKYQLQPTLAQTGQIYKEAQATEPKLSIKTWMELWILPEAMTQPEPGFPQGRPQEQRPPLEGTIQFWTEQSGIKMNTGQQQLLLSRMGQMIRTHIFVGYNSTHTTRADILPNPTQVLWSRVIFKVLGRNIWKSQARTFLTGNAGPVETGVFPLIYSYGQDRHNGANGVNSWLPTVNATRFELSGTWEEGQVDIITNDVAVAATSEVGRREVPGQTSYHAPRGVE